jgi:hypothetical protein
MTHAEWLLCWCPIRLALRVVDRRAFNVRGLLFNRRSHVSAARRPPWPCRPVGRQQTVMFVRGHAVVHPASTASSGAWMAGERQDSGGIAGVGAVPAPHHPAHSTGW